jgi:hypothetical protein
MIKITEKFGGFFDEVEGENTIRRYADTIIKGYLLSLNFTPVTKDFSDILNLDIVISDLPPSLSGRNFNFDYSDGDRLATRTGWGLGEYRHVHLMVDYQQINQLLQFMHQKIKIVGDEIAVQAGGESIFLVDARVPSWIGLRHNDVLTLNLNNKIERNKKMNRTSCHSVSPTEINQTGFFNQHKGSQVGSKVNGEFAQSAAGIAGYGGAIAKQSMKKSRDAGAKSFDGSEAGKNKQAAASVDMKSRIKNLEKK